MNTEENGKGRYNLTYILDAALNRGTGALERDNTLANQTNSFVNGK